MDCSFGQHKGPGHQNKPLAEVKVGDTLIPMVVDTGYSQSMIWADLIPSHLEVPETAVTMVCIHRASYTYEHRQQAHSDGANLRDRSCIGRGSPMPHAPGG